MTDFDYGVMSGDETLKYFDINFLVPPSPLPSKPSRVIEMKNLSLSEAKRGNRQSSATTRTDDWTESTFIMTKITNSSSNANTNKESSTEIIW